MKLPSPVPAGYVTVRITADFPTVEEWFAQGYGTVSVPAGTELPPEMGSGTVIFLDLTGMFRCVYLEKPDDPYGEDLARRGQVVLGLEVPGRLVNQIIDAMDNEWLSRQTRRTEETINKDLVALRHYVNDMNC